MKKEMTKLKDVAALAGVSIATVSNVINETRRVSPATRARVESAASQLGYTPRSTGYREFILHRGGGVTRHETHMPPARQAPARPQSAAGYEAQQNGGGPNAQTNLIRGAGDFVSSAR